jgi:hypothetical protein
MRMAWVKEHADSLALCGLTLFVTVLAAVGVWTLWVLIASLL